jgi:hypothetical protein
LEECSASPTVVFEQNYTRLVLVMQNATFLQRKICLLGLQLIVILQENNKEEVA